MSSSSARPLVLLVDDSVETRDIYAAALRNRGYRVVQAGDGLTGVLAARAYFPDLIVMNISMPRVDGLTAAHRIRREQGLEEVIILACTGFVREDGHRIARAAGCDAYLEKPCPPSVLVREIERLLGDAAIAGGGD